nr:unnamed protein product [Callosobruchus chinensis]
MRNSESSLIRPILHQISQLQSILVKSLPRLWIHPINRRRLNFGSFNHLFPAFLAVPRKFYNYFRMSAGSFFWLLSLIAADITKQNTNYRETITPE